MKDKYLFRIYHVNDNMCRHRNVLSGIKEFGQ